MIDRLTVQDSSSPNKISICPKRERKKEKGKKTFRRHEQKDGGLASDEGVTELIFARGTGPGRSLFMAQDGRIRRARRSPFMTHTTKAGK